VLDKIVLGRRQILHLVFNIRSSRDTRNSLNWSHCFREFNWALNLVYCSVFPAKCVIKLLRHVLTTKCILKKKFGFYVISVLRFEQTYNCLVNPTSGPSVEITNKMQPCIRIYYSTVHWRLNIFRAAYRSSSGALTAFAASGLHTHVVTGHSQVLSGNSMNSHSRLDYGRSPHAYINQRLNTVTVPEDERYAARNMLSLQWTVE
jgi:hypothetical protein